MIDGGALIPLGGTRDKGGHKGFCLAAVVDILSCVLSGANWGPFAPPFALRQEVPGRSVGKGIGHFLGALRIDGFIDPDAFKRQIDEWVPHFPCDETRPWHTGRCYSWRPGTLGGSRAACDRRAVESGRRNGPTRHFGPHRCAVRVRDALQGSDDSRPDVEGLPF